MSLGRKKRPIAMVLAGWPQEEGMALFRLTRKYADSLPLK